MIIKKNLVISGKVQGVGFRYWMQNLAINNNISGWVKNKLGVPDSITCTRNRTYS